MGHAARLMRAARAPRADLSYGSFRAADDLDARTTAINAPGDYHADGFTRDKLQRLSRSLDRNAALGSGPLSMVLGYLLGDGTWPQPRWRAEVTDGAERTKRWVADAQTKRFDADGMLPLGELLDTFGRCVFRDGDAAAVHDGNAAIAIVESDRIRSPSGTALPATARIVQGVEFLKRKPSRLWICDPDTLGRIYANRAAPYDIARCSYVAHRQGRASQVRGVPILTPSLDDIDHLDSLGESEIRSAESASVPTAFLKRDLNSKAPPIQGTIRTASATLITLPEGTEPVSASMGRPNLDVPEFQRLNMRIAYMVLGLPLELLLLDLNQLNYAASRSLRNLAEARLGWWRRFLWGDLLSKLVEAWQRVNGMTVEPVEWDWPRLQLHDRVKEAEADRSELDNGTTSLQRLVGHDALAILGELAAEQIERDRLTVARILAAATAAEAANLAFPGLGLTWQQVIALSPSLAAAPTAPSAPAAVEPPSDAPPAPGGKPPKSKVAP
jgi:hypothetical protein